MFKTFAAVYKHLYKSKWRFVSYLVLLLIPFIYGFIYMNAYWAPFKNSDKLRVAIVNLNETNTKGENTLKAIIKDGKTYKIGDKDFKINFVDKSLDIYKVPEDQRVSTAEQWVKDDDFSAIVVIPKDFGQKTAPDYSNPKYQGVAGQELFKKDWEIFAKDNIIEFYNSYKNNYLAGEMTNFIAGLNKLHLASAFPGLTNIPDFHKLAEKFVSTHINAKKVDSYGFGMSPYFISIALWAGALTMTFLIKNVRHIPGIKTIKHYLGNTLVWILTGWAQATILLTAITLQGVNLGWDHQWELWLFVYFVSFIFSIFVQSIVFAIKYGDIGDFVVVILLVLQLVASSGTFPVEMQNIIFKILHPIAPFTYSIQGIREIFDNPDIPYIFLNMLFLSLFPLVTIPISITRNYLFDKKTFREKNKYESFEVHIGDL